MRKKIAIFAALCMVFTACSRGANKEEAATLPESASSVVDAGESEVSAGLSDTFPGFLPDTSGKDDSTLTAPDAGESVPEMDDTSSQIEFEFSQMSLLNNQLADNVPDDNYRTTYEVFVYSFADSDGDGIGDLEGLYDHLGYINDGQPSGGVDLGANEIWLMPIFPSPTYHKYDTTDYMAIDPAYGTLEDFDKLLEECHARGVNVILDLALNHTSTEHPWFLEAKEYLQNLPDGKDPVREECPYVWYYTFSREQYNGFKPMDDTWYYEARFWEGMPDLNLSTPEVRDELREVMKFWLDRGVDGFRLDAVTSYFTDSFDGNMEFMTWVADTVHGIDPNAYLAGEAWEDQASYSRYYRTGVNSFFDFAYSGADGIIASVAKGNRSAKDYAESLVSEEALYSSINENYINAPFYTNHDLNRGADYYADDDGSRTKFAAGLNLLMTGNAFVYYGEEIGMTGSGKDENKRAPMYWISEDEAGSLEKKGADSGQSAERAEMESGQTAESPGAESGQSAERAGTESGQTAESPGAESGQSAERAGMVSEQSSGNVGTKESGADTQIKQELLDATCDGPSDMDDIEMKFGSVYEQTADEYSIYNYYKNAIRIRNAFPVIARGKTVVDYERTTEEVAAFVREDPDGRYEPVEIFINCTDAPVSVDISQSSYKELEAVLIVSQDEVIAEAGTVTLPAYGMCVMTERSRNVR